MKTNTIITIGRQFGSAGREIGYQIADEQLFVFSRDGYVFYGVFGRILLRYANQP